MPCRGKIIVIKRSGADGTHFPLTAATCLFGRKSECDIRIQLPHVSKEHCKVEVKENGEVLVTNLSSVNPAQLNGNALKQTVRLKHGDIITIIDRSFRFESPQVQQGRRRSAGLDSENFKLFASNQSEDTNETVRIESITTSKVQRKSEGNVIRTTHTRRSLQTTSSESKKDQSPFGELYKMLKSKVESTKKENGQTPVKESSSSPKNVNVKRNFQAEAVSQSPATSRRDSKRSQSSDSATIQSKDLKVEPRSVSAYSVREQSKSPSRGPRNSFTKQKQGSAVGVNSPVISNSAQSSSTDEEAAQDHVQTPRRRSDQQVSQEQEASVSLEKESPRRSRSAENVPSPAGSSRRTSRGQSAPHPTGIENQENSPLPVQSPKGRRSGSKDQTKGTPAKPVGTEEKVNERAQGLATRKSPKKRRSDDLGLTEPPLKRKRVSFGGHLSPELFDKRLPPNSPLKKGATPARRSLSLHSPRAVMRKSFGLRQTMIKEVLERSAMQDVSSPLVTFITPTRRASSSKGAQIVVTEAVPANISVSSPKRSSAVNKKSPSKSPLSVARTPVKQSPNKSPSKTLSLTPLRTSPSIKSPVISPSKTPVKRTPVKPEPATSAKRSFSNVPVSAKKSPVKSLPPTPVRKFLITPSTTPGKRSPSRSPIPVKKSLIKSEATTLSKLSTPGKRSPGRSPSTSPAKKSAAKFSTTGKRSPGRSPSTSPAKKSPAKLSTPGKRSPGRSPSTSPGKKSPAKLSTPGKRSPGRSPAKKSPKLSTPGKRSPGRPPSTTPAKKSPAKLSTPGKRSPGRPPSTTPAKKSPAKLSTPGKRSPGRSPAKKSPKLSTPGKRSPGRPPSTSPAKKSPANLSTPGKRSPGRSPSTTPAKKSPAKLSTPAKRSPVKSPVAKSPSTPAPVKLTRSPASAKKSSVSISPANRSPATPYTKGRFSVSRVATPPQVVENVSKVLASHTPKHTRKSLTSKKTPARRSRKFDAFEVIRARRRSGASEANLLVAKSWADVVKIGVAKSQKKIDKPVRKAVATKKKLKPKTPAKRAKDVSSTGHADSPATIIVGRAYTRTLNLTGYVPKVVRNEAVKLNPPHNESFTGMAELFSTPESAKQRKSNRFDGSKAGTPKSTTEMSVMQTPEEAGEMVVSPLNSPATTQRKQFARDAVSRLLEVPVSPELSKVTVSENAELEASKFSKNNRKSVGLTGVKRIMRTPKQKGKPVTDPHALRKLLKTPKQPESTQSYTRRSANLEVLSIAQLMKTPRQKGVPVEDKMGITRIMKTPRQKGEPVEVYTGVRRIMRTPKVRGEAVEDMVGIKRLMTTPKVRGQPAEDIDISHLMSTPTTNTESAENTRPIEEIFGIKNLVKTPPKKSAAQQALAADFKNASEALRPLASSNTPAKRGRQSKRLSLPAETATTVNEVQKTMAVAEFEIAQESGGQSISEVIKSAYKKKGRPSKNIPALPASEMPKSAEMPEVTSPSQRGRPRSTPEVPKESQDSNVDVTSPSRRGRPRSTVLSPIADKATLQANEGGISQVQTESVSEDAISPSRRGRPRSTPEVPKESQVSNVDVTSPSRRGRPRSTVLSPIADKATLQANEGSISQVQTESVSEEAISPSRRGTPRSTAATPNDSVTEVTSPSRRGRASAVVTKESLHAATEVVTSPAREGRLSTTLKATEESHPASQEMTSPTRRGRPSNTAAVAEDLASAVEITSPSRRGRPRKSSEVVKEPLTDSSDKIISPNHRGRASTVETPSESVPNETCTSPTRKGRTSTTTRNQKDSPQASSGKITSPARRGRPSTAAEESDKTDAGVASPSRNGNLLSTSEELKESLIVSETKVVSPSRRGRSIEAAKESLPFANEIVSPKRRGRHAITEMVAKELDPATDGKVKNTRGRPQRTEDVSKESSVSVAAVTLQTRRGRSKDPVEVPKDSVPVTSAVTSPAHTRTTKSTQSSVDKETLQTHEGHSKSTADASKEPASEVTSPRKGRPKASVELAKEPVAVTEEAPTTRRGRAKIAADVPEKLTRRGRTKAKTDLPEEPVPASSRDPISTRRGRPKAAAVIQEPVPEETVDVTSPARRGRPKTADIPKEPLPTEGDVTSPTRRGRPKTTDIPKEPLPAVGEVTSPTRRGRPKTTDIPKEPLPAAAGVTSPTRKGRSKIVEVPKVPIPAASDVRLPTRRGRPKTTDIPKEPLPAVGEVTSPTRRGRPKTADLPEKPVSDSEVTSPARGGRLQNREASKESLPVSVEEPQSNLEDSQKAELSVKTSPAGKPIARRGGRRRNEEQLADIAGPKPEEPKLESRRRGQSKSKNLDETSKTVDVPDQANSPAAKSVKGSAKYQKDIQPEPPVKKVRGRPSRNAQKDNSAEISTSEVAATTDLSPKRTPTKGRSPTIDTSDVSVEEQEQESRTSAPVSKQRGRRKNQESTNKTSQVQTEPTATETSRATRGKRGLPDGEQPQPAEIKGKKTARSKDSGEPSVIERHSKSVQWHPLLTTDVNAKSTAKVEETTIEASTRGSRSKGRTKADMSEAIPAKRPRRENSDDKSEPPAISEGDTSSNAADVFVSKGRRGRRPAIPQEHLEDKSSDVQSSPDVTARSPAKQALQKTRERYGSQHCTCSEQKPISS
ncbi:PREDICTED: antigen KI-67 [Nanorana parkeri]|uniref:antigen KI-67 n=1 Tax=Nanorana parkeri TaxID=125878 RepID=UPI0008546875|nr:PREDICTED: antigen KI-67 [Nanorana parkeri]